MKTRLRLLLALGGLVVPFALTIGNTSAQAVVQAYQTDTTLQVGMVVQLTPNDATKVQASTQQSAANMYGAVVAANDAPFALSGTNALQQVSFATTGDYKVLVSDQNGSIKKNDYIAISSLDGIGMKAGTTEGYVLGKALGNFDSSSDLQGQTTVKDTAGVKRTVDFGYVRAAISIGHNPLYQVASSNVPGFLQKLTDSVANKPVSAIRIYIGLGILLATVIIVFSLLYAGVRTGMLSLGRNPLARKSIIRSLSEVVLTGLIVLICGLFGVYLLLKL